MGLGRMWRTIITHTVVIALICGMFVARMYGAKA
jgi:hypothetical protein